MTFVLVIKFIRKTEANTIVSIKDLPHFGSSNDRRVNISKLLELVSITKIKARKFQFIKTFYMLLIAFSIIKIFDESMWSNTFPQPFHQN